MWSARDVHARACSHVGIAYKDLEGGDSASQAS
jgi:hypothetical protein